MLDTQNLMEGRYGRESAQMEDKSKQRKERKDGKTDDNFQSASRKSSAVKVEENKKEWPTTPFVMESQQWKSLVKHKTQIQVKILKKRRRQEQTGSILLANLTKRVLVDLLCCCHFVTWRPFKVSK